MIPKETARKILFCYQEIEAGEELLGHLEKKIASGDHFLPEDTHGHLKYCQLCISLDENPDELFDIHPKLARSVIRAHIAEKKKELAEANEIARVELYASIKPGKIDISEPVDTRPTGS